jgi:hypothetical protein
MIPATWEAEGEGPQTEADLAYNGKLYLKTKLKQKGLGVWLEW